MGKRRKNKSNQTSSNQQNVIMSENFDYQKLSDAIVEAHFRVKDEEALNEQKVQKEFQREWDKKIGNKEYENETNIFLTAIHFIRNLLSIFIHILFFKKEDVQGDIATKVLLKIILKIILGFLKWFFYFITIYYVVISFYSFEDKTYFFNGVYLYISILPLLFARIIRIAQFEIENMKESEHLISVFSAIISFIAMILAIIAIIIK